MIINNIFRRTFAQINKLYNDEKNICFLSTFAKQVIRGLIREFCQFYLQYITIHHMKRMMRVAPNIFKVTRALREKIFFRSRKSFRNDCKIKNIQAWFWSKTVCVEILIGKCVCWFLRFHCQINLKNSVFFSFDVVNCRKTWPKSMTSVKPKHSFMLFGLNFYFDKRTQIVLIKFSTTLLWAIFSGCGCGCVNVRWDFSYKSLSVVQLLRTHIYHLQSSVQRTTWMLNFSIKKSKKNLVTANKRLHFTNC